jgi:exodeoxyribonuclease VII large subunit
MSPGAASLGPMLDGAQPAVEGIPGSRLPGPYPVGAYAAQLKARLRQFAQVQLVGELWGLRRSRARAYFELRDERGALPCSMWLSEFDALGLEVEDGVRVVVGGGCDYYPGSASSSPSFSFAVSELRIAGEGDLLAALQRLRVKLAAEGLFEPQKRLPRPAFPRTIGVVTGERGKARDDVLAGLARRGWAGRLVWAFAPVQDRHAAPQIAAALRELAAIEDVEVVIVARGGGSLADLFAFCDETLCRTVALLRVPVISSVGHHTDRTLIDDVAAVCCSTPTHAAEAAVPIGIPAARESLRAFAVRLEGCGRRGLLARAQLLAQLSRAPFQHLQRHRTRLHQLVREMRASGRRAVSERRRLADVHLLVLRRGRERALGSDAPARRRGLERLALALAAHDPERTLQRGYALVEDRLGELVTSASGARRAGDVSLRFADGRVPARVPPGDGSIRDSADGALGTSPS